jgi:aminoacrylate hydrolase
MAVIETQGISLHYEVLGNRSKPPVLLISGLGGAGSTWGSQVERFAKDYFVVLPDQRGTGRSSRSSGGYTIDQLGADMASLLQSLNLGPVHIIGSSTGGAIGQAMALNHPEIVRSLTMSSSFARFDAYVKREFDLRRKLTSDADIKTIYSCYAIFLFSPKYASDHPEKVQAWIDLASERELEREVSLKRIDMIAAHNTLARLRSIQTPSLVLCGDQDLCTPRHLSEEIAREIANAKLAIFEGGGHMIHFEQEEKFFNVVHTFISQH